jgi:hypothetical protein
VSGATIVTLFADKLLGTTIPATGRLMTVRALATLCALLASGCHLVLDLEDHDVDPGGPGGAGNGGAGSASGGASGVGGGVLRTKALVVEEDSDDCVWTVDHEGTNQPEERLAHDTENYRLFVGTDADNQRMGFRFPLAGLAGAEVQSARLQLSREQGNNDDTRRLVVRVWDTPAVTPFEEGHPHGPDGHQAQGFWVTEIEWKPLTGPGLDNSPNLAPLLQRIIDHPELADTPEPYVGLVVFPVPDGAAWYVGYQDSSSLSGDPPRLELEYIEH